MKARLGLLAVFIVAWRAATAASNRRNPSPEPVFPENTVSSEASADLSKPAAYDLRRAAAINAPIIGTISGFVVTAVVLVFGIAARHEGSPAQLGHATGLLVLGLLGCLLGAFAFSAIAAEGELTCDLPAAAVHAGTCTAIGVTSIIAAFEVLSKAFLPESKPLFAVITVGTAIAAIALVALLLGDVWVAVPDTHWLGTRHKGGRWATALTRACSTVVVVAYVVHTTGRAPGINDSGVRWFVGVGIVLSIATGVASLFRTFRSELGEARAIRRDEVLVILGLMTAYLSALVLLMA